MFNAATAPPRSGWQLALAVLLVLVGLVVLGHTVVATTVSVHVIGWSALTAAVVGLLAAVLLRADHRTLWLTAVSGGLSGSLGLVILRHPDAAATTLTLIAGAIFLAGGLQRLATAAGDHRSRAVLVGAGLASVAFGVFVLSDVASASATLLGRFVGLQILLDGLSLLLVGRLHVGLRERRHPQVARA